MRLLVLSLLALGAQAHSIAYRTNLLSYTPARGEFPVVSGVAQGYVRYLDSSGAERLVRYDYPEPLYGIRRLSYGNEDIVNPLLRVSSTSQERTELFRAWCEQRYSALRAEIERLRAEGKKPSANMLAQFEPLEQIIKTSAFEDVPGLTPEVQRARDEHLRIWNEARLQVLRAEEAQMRLASQQQYAGGDLIQVKTAAAQSYNTIKQQQELPLLKKTPIAVVQNVAQGPQPVKETAEVLRAREDHLKQFNAALLKQSTLAQVPFPVLKTVPGIQQPQPIAPITPLIVKTTSFVSQQAPRPVEETPEVKRAREEHLKKYNEAILRQSVGIESSPQQQLQQQSIGVKSVYQVASIGIGQQPQPVQDTAEVLRAREEHLRILNQAKLEAEDKVADIEDKIRYEEREREDERLREIELRRGEEREAQLERQREAERVEQETRQLEAARIALQQEEQKRIENERYEEAQRLKAEQLEQQKYKSGYESESSNIKLLVKEPQVKPQQLQQQQQQLQQNGFFLRIQSNQGAAVPALVTEPVSNGFVISDTNPFLVRYTQAQSSLPLALSTGASTSAQTQLKAQTTFVSDTSELEKARREHFRAHEIALEQLRVANEKNPWNPDCN